MTIVLFPSTIGFTVGVDDTLVGQEVVGSVESTGVTEGHGLDAVGAGSFGGHTKDVNETSGVGVDVCQGAPISVAG
jgi:hypothetical protein